MPSRLPSDPPIATESHTPASGLSLVRLSTDKAPDGSPIPKRRADRKNCSEERGGAQNRDELLQLDSRASTPLGAIVRENAPSSFRARALPNVLHAASRGRSQARRGLDSARRARTGRAVAQPAGDEPQRARKPEALPRRDDKAARLRDQLLVGRGRATTTHRDACLRETSRSSVPGLEHDHSYSQPRATSSEGSPPPPYSAARDHELGQFRSGPLETDSQRGLRRVTRLRPSLP